MPSYPIGERGLLSRTGQDRLLSRATSAAITKDGFRVVPGTAAAAYLVLGASAVAPPQARLDTTQVAGICNGLDPTIALVHVSLILWLHDPSPLVTCTCL